MYLQVEYRRFSRELLRALWLVSVIVIGQCVTGCRDNIELPPIERVAEFESAGPEGPTIDTDRLVRAKIPAGPYRVNFGDVLALDLPAALYPDMPMEGTAAATSPTHTCRVGEDGLITLPDGQQVSAADKPLGQIEAAVVDLYYPRLVKTRPSVYARVLEYRTYRVQISGAVTTPGVYALRQDQLSLVALLMEAGGIVADGAAIIRIDRADTKPAKSVQQAVGRLSSDAGDFDSFRSLAGPAPFDGAGSSPVGLAFEREGPLATTGWLDVWRGDVVLTHTWLDIGNGPQRLKALRKVMLHLEPEAVALLDTEAERLSQFLASGTDAFGHWQDPGRAWRRSGDDRYVASLTAAVDARDDQRFRPRHGVVRAAQSGDLDAPERITRADGDTALVMPVRGLNIPFADVALHEGDTVMVERIKPQWVSVLGLVNAPGNFPYPPESQYRLAEVIALAGGLNLVAEPRYVSVYRLRADGEVIGTTFQLVDPDEQESLTQQLALQIKPGDVVSVEQTPRTRTNLFLDRVFRISLGLYLNPDTLWE